jgi:hypothetical protein
MPNFTTKTAIINPTERLQEAFEVLNNFIFSDEIPYHVIVPRRTRSFQYGETNELPISPVYFGYPKLTIAELLHQMEHVWGYKNGVLKINSDHKGHYHPVKFEDILRECGLEMITDTFLKECLPANSYQLREGSDADVIAEYIIEDGIIPATGMDAIPLSNRKRSKRVIYKCSTCPRSQRVDSENQQTNLKDGWIIILCGRCKTPMEPVIPLGNLGSG